MDTLATDLPATPVAIVTVAAAEQLVGGTYLIDKDGLRTLVTPPTADHPEGNRPRVAAADDFADAAISPAAAPVVTPAKSTKTALVVVKDAAAANPHNPKGGEK